MTKKKAEKDQFIFFEDDDANINNGMGISWEIPQEQEDDDGSGEAGGSGSKKPLAEGEDAHKAAFHEASVRGQLRAQEEKFGKILAEKNIDRIFTKLLEKLADANAAEQEAMLDAVAGLAAHPLLDSQMFDGMEADLNLNPEAVSDPEQRQELRNRLELKKELKLRLQQKLGLAATPRPVNL